MLTALWVDALKDICAFVEDVQNPSRQGSYQTLVMTKFTAESRFCCRGRGEREEGTEDNKGWCLPEENLPTRESTGSQGRQGCCAVVTDGGGWCV